MIRYPKAEIELTDGEEPFGIMARTVQALRAAGASKQDVSKYVDEATSGSYQNMIAVTRAHVTTKEPDHAEQPPTDDHQGTDHPQR